MTTPLDKTLADLKWLKQAKHGTRPVKSKMGQKAGECPTCGKPVELRKDGIWSHKEA